MSRAFVAAIAEQGPGGMAVVREEAVGLLRLVGAAEGVLRPGSRPSRVTDDGWCRRVCGLLPAGRLVLALLVAGTLLVGCAPEREGVAPATTYSAPSPGPERSLEATKQTIIDTYTRLWPALKRAGLAPVERRREILSPYLEEPELGSLLQQVADHRKQGLRPYGRSVVHVFDVRVDGRTATLHDCHDGSGAGLLDEETGEKVNRGAEESHLVATVRQVSDGEWRVKRVTPVEEPCSAAS